MKKLFVLLLALTSLMMLSACSGVPAKKDTPLAAYNILIVRPLNWSDTITDKITGDETKEFVAAQPKLSSLFQTEFEKYASKLDYFDQVIFSADKSPEGAVILEPKIATLDPGIRWVMPGTAFYQGTLKTADGKVVGQYTAKRAVSRPIYSTMMGSIETLITELGEDAASKIPKAKL